MTGVMEIVSYVMGQYTTYLYVSRAINLFNDKLVIVRDLNHNSCNKYQYGM